MKSVEVKNVSMKFNLSEERIFNLKEYIIKILKRELKFSEFWALKDVSFSVERGEVFGILGLNGAGKSTMLKIIAGVMKPTKGTVTVGGRMSPLIELGAGFDMELTGRENIYLNGSVLGYSKKFIEEKFNEIVEFSELQDFLNVPIKNYSSGMVARLGFSIATVVKPDILIVDEILSVGDFLFQDKCKKRIEELIQGETTVILVTHSIKQIHEMCTNAIWLEHGTVKMSGDANEIAEEYSKIQG